MLKKKIQHPNIAEATDVKQPYWYVRVFEPQIQKDGSLKEVRKKYFLGYSQGPKAVARKDAELERDKVLARANGIAQPPEKQGQPREGDFILFERLVQMWREGHMPHLANTTRERLESQIKKHLLSRFTGVRLSEIDHHTVQVWANGLDMSPLSKRSLVCLLVQLFEYAAISGLYLARNPAKKINYGRVRGPVFKKTIPAAALLGEAIARMPLRMRLALETGLLNGMRISEVLGLRWKRLDFSTGMFDIVERWARRDIDVVKTHSSERRGTVGHLAAEYRALWEENGKPGGEAFIFDRRDGSGEPYHDTSIRKRFKRVAAKLGFDYLGFGLHALRRANITWRQEHAKATSIEAARMAGHSRVNQTAKYTQVSDARIVETAAEVSKLWRGPKLVPKKRKGAA